MSSAPQTMRERGYAHFLQGVHTPGARLSRSYPTRDRHSAEEEAEFLAGWEEAARDRRSLQIERRL